MGSYSSIDRKARMRILMWGWLTLAILMLSGVVPARHLAGEYSGNAVVIRPWMLVYNSIILALHGLALLLVSYGATGSIPRAGNAILFWCRKIAFVTFGLAVLSALAMLAAPVAIGSGPFSPGSLHLRLYTVLVYLPCVFRSLGWVCLVVTMLQAGWSERSRVLSGLLLVFVCVDLCLVVWHWLGTEIAVVAVFHPYITKPLFLTPWVCASALFLALLRSDLVSLLRNPETGSLTGTHTATGSAAQRFEAKARLESRHDR